MQTKQQKLRISGNCPNGIEQIKKQNNLIGENLPELSKSSEGVMGMRAMATLFLSTSSSAWHSANAGECNQDYGVLPSASRPGLLHFIGRGRSSTFLLPSDSNLKRIYSRGA